MLIDATKVNTMQLLLLPSQSLASKIRIKLLCLYYSGEYVDVINTVIWWFFFMIDIMEPYTNIDTILFLYFTNTQIENFLIKIHF